MRNIKLIVVLCLLAGPAYAQWLGYRTPGVPRTKDGKPNLTAAAPKTRDGSPDLTGIWKIVYPKEVLRDRSKKEPVPI
ncbi:MAG: hypothetical protein DMG15_16400 [Acidobacteria bacterium]|nr:MAG: hypothetical protein DMG16_02895 [Acidobacteriota bacterium]PYS11820.1 MAG: hypothetical protein DMG15_16400 [Acidobacteriota bacterium]